jgi:hypothetical protein
MNPSLVRKLSYLTSKNRLKLTQVTRNCATQGVLQHSSHVERASLTGESSIMPSIFKGTHLL